MRKKTFADNLRVEPTIVLMEKLSFSLKYFSGHFYGQSFIKTVRGPLIFIKGRRANTSQIPLIEKQRIKSTNLCKTATLKKSKK